MSDGKSIEVVEFAGFRLERRKRRLTGPDGAAIALKAKVFDTLALLAAHPDEVLDKRAIFDAVWPDVTVEENNLNQAISTLRRVFGDSRDEPLFIATVQGRGYRFVAPVRAIADHAAPQRRSPGAKAGSVAVLPFRNLSPEPEQECFADGLSEELINRLHQLDGLRVIGRTSSFAYKHRNGDLRLIGEALGVASLLEGAVRKGGGRLRVSARLVDAGNGFLRWSQTYDRPEGDALAVQEDIARAVAEASSAALGAEDAGDPFFGMGPKSPEAYDLYLRAMGHVAGAGGRESLQGAAQLLRKAAALDPAFLEARLQLARTLYYLAMYSTERAMVVDQEVAEIEERVAAEAPREWIRSWLRARRRLTAGDWLGCSENLAAARALAPPAARARLDEVEAGLSLAVGRIAEALDYVLARVRDDPLSPHASLLAQRALDAAGRCAEAEAEAKRSRALVGDKSGLAVGAHLRALAEGDPARIEATLIGYLESGLARDGVRAHFAVRGDRDAALTVLRDQLARAGEPGTMVPAYAAALATHYGDVGLALLGIRTFLEMLPTEAMSIWIPVLSPARKDPRFKEIMRDFGFLAYWRATGKWGDFCRPLGKDDFEAW